MKTAINSNLQQKPNQKSSFKKSGPDSLVEYVEKNKNEFWKDLCQHRALVIDTKKDGFKKATINY